MKSVFAQKRRQETPDLEIKQQTLKDDTGLESTLMHHGAQSPLLTIMCKSVAGPYMEPYCDEVVRFIMCMENAFTTKETLMAPRSKTLTLGQWRIGDIKFLTVL